MKNITRDPKTGRIRVQTVNDQPSMTQQQHKEAVNVNNIIKKYHKTGMITHLAKTKGVYGDFTKVKDYQTAVAQVMYAHESFMGLSSEIRTRFNNDPGELLKFIGDKKNFDEAVALGIIEKPADKTPAAPPTT